MSEYKHKIDVLNASGITLKLACCLGIMALILFMVDGYGYQVLNIIGVIGCIALWGIGELLQFAATALKLLSAASVPAAIAQSSAPVQRAKPKPVEQSQSKYIPPTPKPAPRAPVVEDDYEKPNPEELDRQIKQLLRYFDGQETPEERNERLRRWGQNLYDKEVNRKRPSG